MEIYNTQTQQILSESEFRAMHDNIAFPTILSAEALAEYSCVAVLASPQPSCTTYQSVIRDGVVQDSKGNYVQAWKIVDWPQEQIDAHKANSKVEMWSRIKAERDHRKVGGVKVGEKWFHSDDASRIQQLGLVMMGVSIPQDLQWKTMDGSFTLMSQSLANQIFQAVAMQDQAAFAKAEQHKISMEASENPAEYDYSSGWPVIYGE